MNGDPYKRVFDGDVAQCGCHWSRELGLGDVLHLCPLHDAANHAEYLKYERTRANQRSKRP